MKTLKGGLRVLNQKEGDKIAKELNKIMEQEKEHHLALWCMEQAKMYSEGKLSKEKIKLLKKEDFPFGYYLGLYNGYNMTFEEYEKE